MGTPTLDRVSATLVDIPAGTFAMGSEDFYPEERPVHPVEVGAFRIEAHPVTVREFRRFVKATGHVTTAERAPEREQYPDADPALLVPGSLVFQPLARSGRPARPPHLVGLRAGRLLAPARGPGVGHLHARRPSRHPRHARGRRRLCGLGRPGAADRGRVGARGARRPGGTYLRVGRRARSRTASRSPTPGRASSRTRTPSRTATRARRRSAASRQRVRPVRPLRQRVGVDRRLVRGRPRDRVAVLRPAARATTTRFPAA